MRFLFIVIFCFQGLFAWGGVGHRIVNKNAVKHLPLSMQKFIMQDTLFANHASDADTRIYQVKPSDTAMFAEQYRHYLDVDEYPDFKNLDRNFNNLIGTYGWSRVKFNGTNPWATVEVMDSLTAQLKRGDWNAAYQSAADLGHYVGDPHQPLHATENYDGKLTGNSGIHSRYESRMIERVEAQISVSKDSVQYITDVYGFAFNYILAANSLCDSIFHADNLAKGASGGSYNDTYYSVMWQQLGDMTKAQIQSATIDIASLWYTAWVNAGLLAKPSSVKKVQNSKPESFNLKQNFPNPFNPKTTIQFEIPNNGNVKLSILSVDGRVIASLVDSNLEMGTYSIDWNAENFSSGVYFCRMETKNFSQTKKLVFLK